MDEQNLKVKLTRKMKNEDFCHQRIFSCIPLLWIMNSEYMMAEKENCDFSHVFFKLIMDWNEQRNLDILEIGKHEVNLAIIDIVSFYTLVTNMYDSYLKGTFDREFYFNKISNLKMDHYFNISKICQIYRDCGNRSKILCRLVTFKKKSKKLKNGVISLDKFITKEVLPQKEFLDTFVDRLKSFSIEQFPIFMLCYDIRKSNESIFTKAEYDDKLHFF